MPAPTTSAKAPTPTALSPGQSPNSFVLRQPQPAIDTGAYANPMQAGAAVSGWSFFAALPPSVMTTLEDFRKRIPLAGFGPGPNNVWQALSAPNAFTGDTTITTVPGAKSGAVAANPFPQPTADFNVIASGKPTSATPQKTQPNAVYSAINNLSIGMIVVLLIAAFFFLKR